MKKFDRISDINGYEIKQGSEVYFAPGGGGICLGRVTGFIGNSAITVFPIKTKLNPPGQNWNGNKDIRIKLRGKVDKFGTLLTDRVVLIPEESRRL